MPAFFSFSCLSLLLCWTDRQPKSYSNHRSTVRKTFKLFNGMPNHVKIVEVGARDGLQNKKKIVPTSVKLSDAKDVMEAVKDLEGARLHMSRETRLNLPHIQRKRINVHVY
ncbi:hydroxymethylglutaryl-CoA lyase, mitochondrial-like isoform X4 [Solanum tuberosum]|uniref:hydroxymethylglutaryl-CoA lyase, mitochondrial-like isoform X4 n=1 Tax=Solanum tuberosum TaxID=4113 RepID=UPI00073A2E34|nr:PREDICTED: hydroxymethylglutaryl-CoA lyase, mitochondrial-like isoform X4 [Solanum tuberosum]